MKNFTLILLLLFCCSFIIAQNTGVGTTNPVEKLDVDGSIRSSILTGDVTRNVVANQNGVLTIGGVVYGVGNEGLTTNGKSVTCDNSTSGLYMNSWGRYTCQNGNWVYEGIGFFNNGDGVPTKINIYMRAPLRIENVRVVLSGGTLKYDTGFLYSQVPDGGAVYEGQVVSNEGNTDMPTSVVNSRIYLNNESYTGELWWAVNSHWVNLEGPSHNNNYEQNHWFVGNDENGISIAKPYLLIPFFSI